ncbi:MAG: GGDEF domain-containing protein [Colwellia sp.]
MINTTYLKHHKHLLAILFISIVSIIGITNYLGELKLSSEFDYIDAIGEGGITLVTLIWILFILVSRPVGKVTNWLFSGLLLMHISMLLDFIDEFIHYPLESTWITAIESLPAPVGMIIMTIALYHLYQEQLTINSQLKRTERFYRDHSQTDFITGLYSATYMKQQIAHELIHCKSSKTPFSLVMIDICQFDQFNRQYGHQQGDYLLREVGQVITMNIRDQDLACRYASDRFIVLLPNTKAHTTQIISEHIKVCLANLAFKVGLNQLSHYQKVTLCFNEFYDQQEVSQVLEHMNKKMLDTKARASKRAA